MVLRLTDEAGVSTGDVICREHDSLACGDTIFDPHNPARHKKLGSGTLAELHQLQIEDGHPLNPAPDLKSPADHAAAELRRLPEGSLRLHNPHLYKISISAALNQLRDELLED